MSEASTEPKSETTEPPASPQATASDEKKAPSNFMVRLLTAVVAVPFLLAMLFWLPKWIFAAFVFVCIAAAAAELGGMVLPGRRLPQAALVVGSVAVVAVLMYVDDALPSVLIGLALIGMLVNLFAPEPIEHAAARTAWTVGGPLYIGGLLATIPLLHRHDDGGAWVILTMMFAWFGDTGGYFAGRAFGKRKLYPLVSPKKTVEGAIGGLCGSVAGALIMHFTLLPQLPLHHGIPLAIVSSALGQTGDLCESLIKRSVGVKDSGWIVPGHGGLLDRIDALMFVAPATWLYVHWFVDR